MTTEHLNDLISKAMVDLLYLHTTLGSVVVNNHGVKVTENADIPALAYCDGKGIFINKHYIDNVYEKNKKLKPLTKDNMVFLIAHEASHLITLTVARSVGKNEKYWNYATDYAINSLLYNNYVKGIHMPIGHMIEGGLYNPKFQDMSAEEIYKIICPEGNNGSSNQSENKDKQSVYSSGGNSKSVPESDIVPIDQHIDISDNDREAIQTRVNDVLSQHDFSTSSSAIERLLKLRPKIPFPWRTVLSNCITEYINTDYTWQKPSKISLATGHYLPSEDKTPSIKIAVGIDTSGSIEDKDLSKFFSHLTSILSAFDQVTLEIHCFSTQVHKETIKTVTENDLYTRFFSTYKLNSFGGTDIASSFKYIEDHESDFDVYICMTDGEDIIDDLTFTKTKVIWAITNNPDHTFTNPPKVKDATIIYLDKDPD